MRASLFVAGPGVEPGLRDYEPHVQPYTTPHDGNNSRILAQFFYRVNDSLVPIFIQTSFALPKPSFSLTCDSK